MNPEAILSLISDLVLQVHGLSARLNELEAQLLDEKEPAVESSGNGAPSRTDALVAPA